MLISPVLNAIMLFVIILLLVWHLIKLLSLIGLQERKLETLQYTLFRKKDMLEPKIMLYRTVNAVTSGYFERFYGKKIPHKDMQKLDLCLSFANAQLPPLYKIHFANDSNLGIYGLTLMKRKRPGSKLKKIVTKEIWRYSPSYY